MYSNVYNYKDFMPIRNLIERKEFKKAYDLLQSISNKCSEWYYLNGISAMNIGYYEEGQDCIKRAKFMDPDNKEYLHAFNQYNSYRNDYDNRSYNYNRRRRNDLGGCCCCCDDCCCCCGDDCCDNLCKLWCADSCCECFGGDIISCC